MTIVIVSDLHLGWVPVIPLHEALLAALPALVDDADTVVLNGDIIDVYRGQPTARARALVEGLVQLVVGWRGEGRAVFYIEGNHDTIAEARGPLVPDRWHHDLEGDHGEPIRILHGHRRDETPVALGAYEGIGRELLRRENEIYAAHPWAQRAYRLGPGWLVGAIGRAEDLSWRPGFIRDAQRWSFRHVVHGHFHFGPVTSRVGATTFHRSGAWVSTGHLGSTDGFLRYRRGRFERVTLRAGRWRVL